MDALLKQSQNRNANGSSSLFLSSDELGRANDFISSLSENEILSLNASYATVSAATTAATVTANKPQEESHEDSYSQLFPLVSASEGTSSSSSSGAASLSVQTSSESAANDPLNLLPTPIGANCQVVSTMDQVPLNQSLLSQSNSLAEMFIMKNKMNSSLDSLFPNLAASLSAAAGGLVNPSLASSNHNNSSDPHRVVEADFGATGASPLIVAAAAAASPSASSALSMSYSTALSSSNKNNQLAAALEQSQQYHHHHAHRSQQSTRWNERYQELIHYKQEHGDCNVPYLWEKNRPLSEWVKRQRHQYKLKKEAKHSALTDEREALLSNLGFVWNSRASLWDGRFQELVQYYHDYGNLKVSKRTPQHRALSVWLKRQRHACRLFLAGDQTTCMTEQRMQKLLDLGVKIHKKA